VIVGGAAVLLGTVLVVGAWGVDNISHRDAVTRNVSLAGVPVGGLDRVALDAVIDDLAADFAGQPLVIAADGLTIATTNADAGVAFDQAAVRARVMSVGRAGGVVGSFRSWFDSLTGPITIDPVYTVDPAVTVALLERTPGAVKVPPVEPGFSGATGVLEAIPGRDGVHLDPDLVVDALAAEVQFGAPPFTVAVAWSPMAPRFGSVDVAAGIARAEEIIASPLTVRINGKPARIGRQSMLNWIESVPGDDGLIPVFDEQRAQKKVEFLLDGFGTPLPQPIYDVTESTVHYRLDGKPAVTCCGPGVAGLLYRAAVAGGRSIVFLPGRATEPDGGVERVKRLGITELVGGFTTEHACCQNRVKNIHRIADIVRGVIIEPGERFSVNDFVGRRTREKGFVSAGTIQMGRFKDDVGGGISQFATTMFNAAFFAGLDFADYKAHSIYIARYPYGREATLNYPDVDLAVVNNTPYAVLVWTSYDETSITVQMYSTKYWTVEETGQTTSRFGACRRVETFRRRTSPTGEILDDSVFAIYRPGVGLDCRGHATPRP